MAVQYLTMQEKDIDKVLELFKKLKNEAAEVTFADLHDMVSLRNDFKLPNTFYYIAIENNQLVSVFRGRRGQGNQDHCALITIAVAIEYRGRQMTKPFLNYCLQQLSREGISLARAYVFSDNRPSINMLLSAGFTVSGCVFQHHQCLKTGDLVDDIIFHKQLNK